MAPFPTLVTFIAAALCLPTVIARPAGTSSGPACAFKNRGLSDCVAKCSSNWGWNGGILGADRWGPVVLPSGTSASLDALVSRACGSTAPAVPKSTQRPIASIELPKNAAPLPSSYVAESSAPATSATVASFLSSLPVSSTTSSSSVIVSSINPSANFVQSRSLIPATTSSTSSASPSTTVTSTRASPTPTIRSPVPTSTSTRTSTRAPAQPTTSVVNPPASGGSSGDRQTWLDSHNAVRARHGASPLVWGDDLEAAARSWASQCKWQHSQGAVGSFGENLAAGTGSYPPSSAVNGWAAEVSEYDPANPTFSHFTQVVWKSTTRLGCATVTCNNGMIPSFGSSPITSHVCEYDPPGNFIGRFPENVQV